MKITFIGTGSAFAINNHNASIVIESEKYKTLVDAGSDIKHSLHNAGLKPKDIDNIIITHLHGDHCHGLEYLGFSTYFDPTAKKPNLFIHKSLKDNLWGQVLKGTMEDINGQKLKLSDYFNIVLLDSETPEVVDSQFTMELIKVPHVSKSFGIKINENIFYSGDSTFMEESFYRQFNIVFHDCEIAPYKSGFHAHYTDFEKADQSLFEDTKFYLYHYQDNEKPVLNDNLKFVKELEVFNF